MNKKNFNILVEYSLIEFRIDFNLLVLLSFLHFELATFFLTNTYVVLAWHAHVLMQSLSSYNNDKMTESHDQVLNFAVIYTLSHETY